MFKNDLIRCWAEWTGHPVSEVRHRVRWLFEAGLLPKQGKDLTIIDVVMATLGIMCSDQHQDAPERVLQFAAFRCQSPNGATKLDQRIARGTLADALELAWTPPYAVADLLVSPSDRTAMLTIVGHNDFGAPLTYGFADPEWRRVAGAPCFVRSNRINFALAQQLRGLADPGLIIPRDQALEAKQPPLSGKTVAAASISNRHRSRDDRAQDLRPEQRKIYARESLDSSRFGQTSGQPT